jgi:Rrf2 family iron-sulfur cluster assembly transcriptional regulator
MPILSRTCVHGILASVFVESTGSQNGYVPIHIIAEKLDIPFDSLTKIFQKFTSHEIMVSRRGPKGGVSLARDAREITLMDIILALESKDIFENCILGMPGCGDEKPCPLHEYWGGTRDQIKSTFEAVNLAELSRRTRDDDLRLTR